MNIDRIQSELIRLYGGRSQNVRSGGKAPGSDPLASSDDAGATPPSDGVVLSDRASAISRLFGIVKAAPDEREALVSQLREQVQAGVYQPQDEAVARQMLGLAGAE
jgi:flagellar biosynthesis anti-sigma factor FlgM